MMSSRLSADGRRRVCVIGSGVSGLVAAWLLRHHCDVHIMEAEARPGGHVSTVDASIEGRTWPVDTGFIVFSEEAYPCFSRLLRALRVDSHETDMSFSVRCDASGLEYSGTSLNGLFAQRRNLVRPRVWMMLRGILRFHRLASGPEGDVDDDVTVEAFVRRHRLGRAFTEQYLVPMGAALWSSPPGVFRTFPIRFVIDFFRHHRMLQVEGRPVWRVVTGGSRTYVDRLQADLPNGIRLSAPAARVRRDVSGAEVVMADGRSERFDHVVLACHADQSLRLLESPDGEEREVLSAFPYEANETVLHLDESLMPRCRRAWASWNYHRSAGTDDRSTVTYWMNRLQKLESAAQFFVTLNETEAIDPAKVLARFTYHHPRYTPARSSAQRKRAAFLDRGGVSFCGAYWGYGFHEDGARSGAEVARALGADVERSW